jgi:hypothetical protein
MSKGVTLIAPHCVAITLWRGAGKSRVREEKHVNEKRGLESTEKGDPEGTEKGDPEEPRRASLWSCRSPYVAAARPSHDRQRS